MKVEKVRNCRKYVKGLSCLVVSPSRQAGRKYDAPRYILRLCFVYNDLKLKTYPVQEAEVTTTSTFAAGFEYEGDEAIIASSY